MFAVKYAAALSAEGAAKAMPLDVEKQDRAVAVWAAAASRLLGGGGSKDAATVWQRRLATVVAAADAVGLDVVQAESLAADCNARVTQILAKDGESGADAASSAARRAMTDLRRARDALAAACPSSDVCLRLAVDMIRAASIADQASAASFSANPPATILSFLKSAQGRLQEDPEPWHNEVLSQIDDAIRRDKNEQQQLQNRPIAGGLAVHAPGLLIGAITAAAFDDAMALCGGSASTASLLLNMRATSLRDAHDRLVNEGFVDDAGSSDDDGGNDDNSDGGDGGDHRRTGGNQKKKKKPEPGGVKAAARPAAYRLARAVEGIVRAAFRDALSCPHPDAVAATHGVYGDWEPRSVVRYDAVAARSAETANALPILEATLRLATAKQAAKDALHHSSRNGTADEDVSMLDEVVSACGALADAELERGAPAWAVSAIRGTVWYLMQVAPLSAAPVPTATGSSAAPPAVEPVTDAPRGSWTYAAAAGAALPLVSRVAAIAMHEAAVSGAAAASDSSSNGNRSSAGAAAQAGWSAAAARGTLGPAEALDVAEWAARTAIRLHHHVLVPSPTAVAAPASASATSGLCAVFESVAWTSGLVRYRAAGASYASLRDRAAAIYRGQLRLLSNDAVQEAAAAVGQVSEEEEGSAATAADGDAADGRVTRSGLLPPQLRLLCSLAAGMALPHRLHMAVAAADGSTDSATASVVPDAIGSAIQLVLQLPTEAASGQDVEASRLLAAVLEAQRIVNSPSVSASAGTTPSADRGGRKPSSAAGAADELDPALMGLFNVSKKSGPAAFAQRAAAVVSAATAADRSAGASLSSWPALLRGMEALLELRTACTAAANMATHKLLESVVLAQLSRRPPASTASVPGTDDDGGKESKASAAPALFSAGCARFVDSLRSVRRTRHRVDSAVTAMQRLVDERQKHQRIGEAPSSAATTVSQQQRQQREADTARDSDGLANDPAAKRARAERPPVPADAAASRAGATFPSAASTTVVVHGVPATANRDDVSQAVADVSPSVASAPIAVRLSKVRGATVTAFVDLPSADSAQEVLARLTHVKGRKVRTEAYQPRAGDGPAAVAAATSGAAHGATTTTTTTKTSVAPPLATIAGTPTNADFAAMLSGQQRN